MSRFLEAATRPLHLVPPGLGAVAAGGLLVAGLPPVAVAVGALSLGAWGAMVAWDLLTPAPPAPPPADPVEEFRSPELRKHVRALVESSARVRQQLEAQSDTLAASTVEIQAEEAELVDAALAAARRGDVLWRQLQPVDPNLLQREIEERRLAARRARDPEVARSLGEAADAKEREMAGWRELAGIVDRIEAELVAAEAALDELHVRVVRVAAQDPGEASGLQVRQQVKELAGRLHVLERSAEATLREVG